MRRIEYLGDDHDWALAIYQDSTESYADAVLLNGQPTGHPTMPSTRHAPTTSPTTQRNHTPRPAVQELLRRCTSSAYVMPCGTSSVVSTTPAPATMSLGSHSRR